MTGRRVGPLVAALVGIVLVAVGVVAFVLPDSDDDPTTAPPSPTSTLRAGTAEPPVIPTLTGVDPRRFACPTPRQLDRATAGERLPLRATSVVECGYFLGSGSRVTYPLDHLTRQVEDLVRLVNRSRAVPGDDSCSGTGSGPPALAFGYADGTVRIVRPNPCEQVVVGAVHRSQPRQVYRLFQRYLLDQRRRASPPRSHLVARPCRPEVPDGFSSPIGDETLRIPRVPAAGRACVMRSAGKATVAQTPLSHDELTRLVRYGSSSGRHASRCTRHDRVLVQAVTPWHDDIAFTLPVCAARARGGLDLKGGNEHLLHQIVERAVPIRHRS